jgi:hypothetical protein
MPRDLDLTFDISTGALTLDRVVGNYVKRSETLTLSVTIVSNGASATIPAGLVGTLKPVNTYGTTLAQWTTFSQVGATNVYTASTTINAAAVTTLLGTTTEQANCVFDFAGAGVVESDTLALVLKNNVTRDDDTAPTALLNRNDFLVTNGTGLLVNVAAGYAANGAFVAAQASLAITNATNYIEVTAAGVASVNTTAFTAGSYPLATVVASAGAITANTDLRAWITPKPAAVGGVTSITGTANEITVTGTTTPTLSLPSALTFTGKTVTGGTFNSPTLFEPSSINYRILNTQDGTMKGRLTNDFTHVYLDAGGDVFLRSSDFVSSYLILAHFSASTGRMSLGHSAFLSGKIGFKNATSTGTTTLDSANASANDYTVTLQAATGTLALTTDITGGTLAGSFTTLSASSTTSLLLGTAGSAVGNVGFRNATSGTTTLAPATGALGTGTVTLPLSGTLATLEGSNTYTGTTNTFTLPTTTGSTTTSGIAVAANSLTTGTGIYAASSSLTSGKLLDLQVSGTAAAASQTALNVATAGANGTSGITTKGAVISNTHTGTTSTNVALELTASGATTNTALNVTAGAAVFAAGVYFGGFASADRQLKKGSSGPLVLTNGTNSQLQVLACANIYCGGDLNGGSQPTDLSSTGVTVGSTGFHAWTNTANQAYQTKDLYASRYAAGVLQIGTSSANDAGSIRLTNITALGTLAVTGASTLTGLLTANGGITLGDGQNIAFNTTTGTKIGAATTQKLSFWNATPIVQPTTAVSSATFASPGGGVNIKTDDTFDGYTIAQVVKALRNAGLLA